MLSFFSAVLVGNLGVWLQFIILTILGNFVYFLRYAEELEIQISLCSAGDVMMLTIVTANNLHIRWGFHSLSLGLHIMLKIVHYMFISGYCRMLVVDPICAPSIQGVIAVDPMFQGMV